MADQIPEQPAAAPSVPPAPAQAAQPAAPQPEQAAPAAPAPTNAIPSVEQDERFFAALGYFAFLFVIPLIVKPKSEYCKFHAKQSMVLFLITMVIFMILFAIPWFGSLLTLAIFAVYILAIYKSYSGELWAIPVISKFAGKMNVEALYGKAGLAVGALSGLKDKAQGIAEKAGDTVKTLGAQEESSPPAAPPPPPAPAQEAPVAPPPPPPPPPQASPPAAPQAPAQ